jgi:hypothetical protein
MQSRDLKFTANQNDVHGLAAFCRTQQGPHAELPQSPGDPR